MDTLTILAGGGGGGIGWLGEIVVVGGGAEIQLRGNKIYGRGILVWGRGIRLQRYDNIASLV